MVSCSNCGTELAKLKAQTNDGTIKEIYTHPPAWPSPCKYQTDGVSVTVKVVDEILLNKFQDFAGDCQEKEAEEAIISVTEDKREDLLLPAKKRLSAGELGITDYRTIKGLIKDEREEIR